MMVLGKLPFNDLSILIKPVFHLIQLLIKVPSLGFWAKTIGSLSDFSCGVLRLASELRMTRFSFSEILIFLTKWSWEKALACPAFFQINMSRISNPASSTAITIR
jgi:hypothetical protein